MTDERRPQDAARRAAEEIHAEFAPALRAGGALLDSAVIDFMAEVVQRAIDSATPQPASRTFEEWAAYRYGDMGMPETHADCARSAWDASAASARGEGWVSVEERLPKEGKPNQFIVARRLPDGHLYSASATWAGRRWLGDPLGEIEMWREWPEPPTP